MKIGIWMSCGPRQPSGFTPASRYSFIVSSERRLGSEYFFWISCWRGAISCILREVRKVRRVSGNVIRRVITVKSRIASP